MNPFIIKSTRQSNLSGFMDVKLSIKLWFVIIKPLP